MRTLLIIMFVALLLASGCAKEGTADNDTATVTPDTMTDGLSEKPVEIVKEKDGCADDADCRYVWFTGGCHTPEFVEVFTKGCRDGLTACPSEAPPRENVTCSCEGNVCATQG